MAEETPRQTRFEPLSALWRVLAAPETLLVLMGLVALAFALSMSVPQIPPQATGDPEAWLATQTGFFRQASGPIRALGLFSLFHAFWFHLLLALTGLCLSVRAVESIEWAWRATGQASWTQRTEDVQAAFAAWGHRPAQISQSSCLPGVKVKARLGERLRGHGYWVIDVPASPVPSLLAGRHRAALWARPAVYGGLLLTSVGLAILTTWSWQSDLWQAVPGDTRAIGHGLPFAVRLDAFNMQWSDGQRLLDYRSEIAWLEGDAELAQEVVGVGHPATRQGVTVRQVGYSPIVRVRGHDANGRPLTLETEEDVLSITGEAEIRFASPASQSLVFVPDQDLFLAFRFQPGCDSGTPALKVDRIRGDGTGRQEVGVLTSSGSLSVDGLAVDVGLTFVPILRIEHRPAMSLVLAGMLLTIIALFFSWMAAPWLVWIALGPGEDNETKVQILPLPGAGLTLGLPRLTKSLREALADET
jgi:ResB-like family